MFNRFQVRNEVLRLIRCYFYFFSNSTGEIKEIQRSPEDPKKQVNKVRNVHSRLNTISNFIVQSHPISCKFSAPTYIVKQYLLSFFFHLLEFRYKTIARLYYSFTLLSIIKIDKKKKKKYTSQRLESDGTLGMKRKKSIIKYLKIISFPEFLEFKSF